MSLFWKESINLPIRANNIHHRNPLRLQPIRTSLILARLECSPIRTVGLALSFSPYSLELYIIPIPIAEQPLPNTVFWVICSGCGPFIERAGHPSLAATYTRNDEDKKDLCIRAEPCTVAARSSCCWSLFSLIHLLPSSPLPPPPPHSFSLLLLFCPPTPSVAVNTLCMLRCCTRRWSWIDEASSCLCLLPSALILSMCTEQRRRQIRGPIQKLCSCTCPAFAALF